LARRCGEILRDDALYARLASRARVFAQDRFSLARMLDESQALYS